MKEEVPDLIGWLRARQRPARVFISYRRDDAAPYAGRLHDALVERFGEVNVFMDVGTIALGADYSVAIDRALASCDAVVALIGRNWLEAKEGDGSRRLDDPNDVLRLELERALSGTLVVIPTCVQGAELPAEGALPPSLMAIARRQGMELRDEAWHHDVARLVRRLEQTVRPEGSERRLLAPIRSRRWLAAAIGALVLVAGGSAALIMVRRLADSRGATPAEQLLQSIPAVIRAGCGRIDWGPESALVSVECSAPRVAVAYSSFASAALLDGWYVLAREQAGVGTDSGSCTAEQFSGEGVYLLNGAVAGRRFCYFEGSEAKLVWTDVEARVGAQANVWEGTGPQAAGTLLSQWECCLKPQR